MNIILKELKKVETDQEDLSELLIKFTILHGQLMDVINSSRSEDGHKGKKISAIEKKEIFESFESLENKISTSNPLKLLSNKYLKLSKVFSGRSPLAPR